MKKYVIDHPILSGYIAGSNDLSFCPVIIIGGSEGRVHKKYADLLAGNGIFSFALGYFDTPNTPKNLEYIDLEYIVLAIEWLKKLTKHDEIVLIGYSHGAQLALLIASYFPDLISKVVCFSPISYVLGGFPYVNRPAWKFQGKPLDSFLKGLSSHDIDLTVGDDLKQSVFKHMIPFRNNTESDPFIVKDLFDAMEEKTIKKNESSIPVITIKASMLLFSGEDDCIWNGFRYAEEIKKNAKYAKEIIHFHYQGVGHGIFESYNGSVYCRIGEFWCHMGGDPIKNDEAERDAWRKTIAYIKGEL
jgi:pimeloyl-ACP methyl ester carboxylesterase